MHILHKEKIKQHFNKASKTYNQHCALQTVVGKKLIETLLLTKKKSQCVIDLGCGTGVVTAMLAQQLIFQRFQAIDIANHLLQQAQPLLISQRVQTKHDDFDQLLFIPENYDIIFSNMALHWSVDIEILFKKLYSALMVDGVLAFSLPLIPTFCELKKHYRYDFYTVEEIQYLLQLLPFRRILHEINTITLLFASPLAALKSIKLVGANYVSGHEQTSLRGKSFAAECFEHIGASNACSLTYHIGYFIAEK